MLWIKRRLHVGSNQMIQSFQESLLILANNTVTQGRELLENFGDIGPVPNGTLHVQLRACGLTKVSGKSTGLPRTTE